MPLSISAREALFATLCRQVERLEGGHLPEDDRPVSTGSPALDRLLPAGGLRRGKLVEYLAPASGCGAGTYCPDALVTRAQMAVFLVRTFNLP